MSSAAIRVEASDLCCEVAQGDSRVVVMLSGTADLRVTDRISAILSEVHQRVLAGNIPSVKVDFLNLEFMNSSCFKCFVKWITEVDALPKANQYRIRFISNPAILWQRRSLHALSCFAAELISIEAGS